MDVAVEELKDVDGGPVEVMGVGRGAAGRRSHLCGRYRRPFGQLRHQSRRCRWQCRPSSSKYCLARELDDVALPA